LASKWCSEGVFNLHKEKKCSNIVDPAKVGGAKTIGEKYIDG